MKHQKFSDRNAQISIFSVWMVLLYLFEKIMAKNAIYGYN